jgi:hypothetical protein
LFLAEVTMLFAIVPMVLAPVTMFIAVIAVLIAAIGVISVVLTIMGNGSKRHQSPILPAAAAETFFPAPI